MLHPDDCTCDTYGCSLRRKGVQLSPKATPNRRNSIPPRRPNVPGQPIVYQDRPGGFRMPIMTATGDFLRRKQYLERKHEIDDTLNRIRQTGTATARKEVTSHG